MTFTVFSLAITLFIAALILKWVMKGMKRGFSKMLVTLSIFLISIVFGVIIARTVSDPLTDLMVSTLDSNGLFADLETKVSHIRLIFRVIIDALITPIIFIAVFFVLKAVVELIVGKISDRIMRDLPYDTENKPVKEPWHSKNSKPLGAALGVVCGILTSIVIISPIYGTVQTMSLMVDFVYGEKALIEVEQLGSLGKELESIKKYSNDIPCTALDVVGGKVLYQSLSYSKLEYDGVHLDSKGVEHPEHIELEIYVAKESETLKLVLEDAGKIVDTISTSGNVASKESIAAIRTIADDLERSDLFKLVSADILSGAAKNWRMNTTYLQVPKPDLGSSGNYLFDVILFILENTDYTVVPSDINTMLNVLEIMVDSELMSESNYDELLLKYEENETYKKLCAELASNPRTAMIPDQVTAMTVNIAAQAFDQLLSEEQYDKVTISLASQWNDISSVADRETKVTVISQKTIDVAAEYEVDMPNSIAQATAEAMVSQFDGRNNVTSKDMDNFLTQYKDFNFAEQPEE